MKRLPFVLLVFLSITITNAQSIGFKTGVLIPKSRPGYLYEVFGTFKIFQVGISRSEFYKASPITGSRISVIYPVYSRDFIVNLAPGMGVLWIEGFEVNGVREARHSIFLHFDLQLVDDGMILDIGYRAGRIVGTHDFYYKAFHVSYGFRLNF